MTSTIEECLNAPYGARCFLTLVQGKGSYLTEKVS